MSSRLSARHLGQSTAQCVRGLRRKSYSVLRQIRYRIINSNNNGSPVAPGVPLTALLTGSPDSEEGADPPQS